MKTYIIQTKAVLFFYFFITKTTVTKRSLLSSNISPLHPVFVVEFYVFLTLSGNHTKFLFPTVLTGAYPSTKPSDARCKIPRVLSSRPAMPKQARLVNPFGRGSVKIAKSTNDKGVLNFNSSLGLTL